MNLACRRRFYRRTPYVVAGITLQIGRRSAGKDAPPLRVLGRLFRQNALVAIRPRRPARLVLLGGRRS